MYVYILLLLNHFAQKILDARELHFKFLLPLHSADEEVLRLVNQMVQTARVVCMNEVQKTISCIF